MIRFLLFIFILALTGCNEKRDYSFYMTHPKQLQTETRYCESLENPTAAQTQQCNLVQRVLADFVKLVKERNDNPEAFGEKIQQVQIQLASLKEELTQLKSSKDIDTKKLAAAEQDYAATLENLKELLAVVAATSSE